MKKDFYLECFDTAARAPRMQKIMGTRVFYSNKSIFIYATRGETLENFLYITKNKLDALVDVDL